MAGRHMITYKNGALGFLPQSLACPGEASSYLTKYFP